MSYLSILCPASSREQAIARVNRTPTLSAGTSRTNAQSRLVCHEKRTGEDGNTASFDLLCVPPDVTQFFIRHIVSYKNKFNQLGMITVSTKRWSILDSRYVCYAMQFPDCGQTDYSTLSRSFASAQCKYYVHSRPSFFCTLDLQPCLHVW